MEVNERRKTVRLEAEELEFLWKSVLSVFFDGSRPPKYELYQREPLEFWKEKIPGNKLSRLISDKSNKADSDIELRKGDTITRRYLVESFSDFKPKIMEDAYLRKLVYYVRPEKYIDLKDFFRKGLGILHESLLHFSPGLRYLEGTWISFNRNLEKGSIARCFYRFERNENEMLVQREGYSYERLYSGKVYMQDETSFLFELRGGQFRRMKFVLANTQQVRPEILRCISSDFGIENGKQILVKELLIKIPDDREIEFNGGEVISNFAIDLEMKKYFDNTAQQTVLGELNGYLGNDENPHFSFEDLIHIKRNHMEEIRLQASRPQLVERLGLYFHFQILNSPEAVYEREIVKYYRKKMGEPEQAVKERVPVFDQYTCFKQVKYNRAFNHTYTAEYRAETKSGAVDMQCLFPFVATDEDLDASYPPLNHSHRIMEAHSDTFITSADFINEFYESKQIAVHFQDSTWVTEVVIDFGSIKDFEKLNLKVESIDFCYHHPAQVGPGMISYRPAGAVSRGFVLLNIDREKGDLQVSEGFILDRENPKVFNLSVNFMIEKGEALYVKFCFDSL